MEINFQIKGIELLNTSFTTPEIPGQPTSYVYNVVVEHKANFESKLLFAIVTVNIRLKDDSPVIGSVSASCYYEVENFEGLIKLNNDGLMIEPELSNAVNSISISTVRGILYSTFKGTFLHNTLLPVFSPLKLQLHK